MTLSSLFLLLMTAGLPVVAQDADADKPTQRVWRFRKDPDLEAMQVLAGTWIASDSGLTCTSKGKADEVVFQEPLGVWTRLSLDVLSGRKCGLLLRGGGKELRFVVDRAEGEVQLLLDGVVLQELKGEAVRGRDLFTLHLLQAGGRLAAHLGDADPVPLEGTPDVRSLTKVGFFSERSQSTFYRLALEGKGVAAAPDPAETAAAEPAAVAKALLEEAEDSVQKGRFTKAVSIYRKLAKDHAGTEAGDVGAQRSQPSAYLGWSYLVRHGPSENRLDLVFMGDGYTLDSLEGFARLAADMPPYFEKQATFREYFPYFNFLHAVVVSKDAGLDEFGREADTALGARRTNSIQGHVGVDRNQVMHVLNQMPYHDGQAVVFVKRGQLGTGSPGVACIGGRSTDTMIHEFGHSFGGLGDEYTVTTHYDRSAARAPNVSLTDDPQQVPWRKWLEERIPGIGVYRGAAGRVKGAWKPTTRSCVMDNGDFFCPICREALVLNIYHRVDPVDNATPEPMSFERQESLPVSESVEFTVQVLVPASHGLEVAWYVVPEEDAPRGPYGWEQGSLGRDRRQRGPLPAMTVEPVELTQHKRRAEHRFTLKAGDFEAGRYRVICRVRDDTLLRGEQHPWVVDDPQGLLQSERSWWVDVRKQ